jgi:hypothetical protein
MEKKTDDRSLETTRTRAPWVPMTMTYVGDVKDLVKGGGKSGATFDSDPTATTKRGGG